jgi:hypothetical protein
MTAMTATTSATTDPRTSLDLIVDGQPMHFHLHHLPVLGEWIATGQFGTEAEAHRAEIALKFSGGYGAWRGYDPDTDTYCAVACFVLADLAA